MSRQTGELVNALNAVSQHVPRVTTELLAGMLPVARQHEFANLLTELGELLHNHADDQAAEVIPTPGTIDSATAPDWLVLEAEHERDDPAGA